MRCHGERNAQCGCEIVACDDADPSLVHKHGCNLLAANHLLRWAAPLGADLTLCRRVDGIGFHRDLLYNITSRTGSETGSLLPHTDTDCTLAYVTLLTRGTYVDLDETRLQLEQLNYRRKGLRSVRAFARHSFIDVERPSFESLNHTIVFTIPVDTDEGCSQESNACATFRHLSDRSLALEARTKHTLHVRYPTPGCGGKLGGLGDAPYWHSAQRVDFAISGPSAAHAASSRAGEPYVSGCYVRPTLPLPAVYLRCEPSSPYAYSVYRGHGEVARGEWIQLAALDFNESGPCTSPLYPVGAAPLANAKWVTLATAGAMVIGAVAVVIVSLWPLFCSRSRPSPVAPGQGSEPQSGSRKQSAPGPPTSAAENAPRSDSQVLRARVRRARGPGARS